MLLKSEDGKKISHLSVYDYLRLIEQAAQLRLKKKEVRAVPQKVEVGLMFLTGHSVLMTPVVEIAGIVSVTSLVPIPAAKPWLIGISSARGELFPVTDLAGMLTGELSTLTHDSRILIITLQQEYFGILVNRILGLQYITSWQMRDTLPKGLMAEYEPFVIGAMLNERFQLPIVSCHAIIRHPMFKNIVQRHVGE